MTSFKDAQEQYLEWMQVVPVCGELENLYYEYEKVWREYNDFKDWSMNRNAK